MLLWFLVAVANAKCVPFTTLDVVGTAPPDTVSVCVIVDDDTQGACVEPEADLSWTIRVYRKIETRGGLFGDRCSVRTRHLEVTATDGRRVIRHLQDIKNKDWERDDDAVDIRVQVDLGTFGGMPGPDNPMEQDSQVP